MVTTDFETTAEEATLQKAWKSMESFAAAHKTCMNPECTEYTLKNCFGLPQDPELEAKKVQICAQVYVNTRGLIKQSIVLETAKCEAPSARPKTEVQLIHAQRAQRNPRLQKGRGEIGCIHTAVNADLEKMKTITASPMSPEAQANLKLLQEEQATAGFQPTATTEHVNKELIMSPTDSFWALNSRVQLMSEMGILAQMTQSNQAKMDQTYDPLYMNNMFHSQLLRAVHAVAPDVEQKYLREILGAAKREALAAQEGNDEWWNTAGYEMMKNQYGSSKILDEFFDRSRVPPKATKEPIHPHRPRVLTPHEWPESIRYTNEHKPTVFSASASSIGETIPSFPDHPELLKKVNIRNGHLQSLVGLPTLPAVTDLNLSRNKLRSLHGLAAEAEFPSLRNLSLMDNYLQDLTGFPQSAPQLKTLNLDNNDLHSLIDLPTSLPALTALHLRNNRITTLRGIPKNAPLQILDLGENPKATLQQLPDGAFLTLKHLNVSNTSHYKDLHTELMPKLEFLDASHLDLSEVPRLHPNAAEQLTFLNLDHNVIRTLRDPTTQHSKFPDELPNLTSLHLHNNAIQSLEGLPQMPNLRVLGLRGNDLTDFRGLPHFAGKDYPYIMFDENPIRSFRGIPEEDFLSFMHENSDNPRSLPSPIRSNVKACHDALQTAVNTHLITTDDLKTMPIARAPDCQKVWAYHP